MTTLQTDTTTIGPIHEHFEQGLARFSNAKAPRVGAELKFPLVKDDGSAAEAEDIDALWRYLMNIGWNAQREGQSKRIVGASKPGEKNDTVASCETGYCKTEFSLAHVANLHDLQARINDLLGELRGFTEQTGLRFLGCGIHPVTPPGRDLLMKKKRAGTFERLFSSNHVLDEDQGDDMHLFTINSGSHVHLSLGADEAIDAVNVLSGFAPAQIALSANSGVWNGQVDPDHRCVSEAFWDWWQPAEGRVGLPPRAFDDLIDYANHVADMPLLYVKRDQEPITLEEEVSLGDFLTDGEAEGQTIGGQSVTIEPKSADVELHNSCYWYNARVSRYFTVENRIHDQQPPEDLMIPAAITLGLGSALDEASEELADYDWDDLAQARVSAYQQGLQGSLDGKPLTDFAARMVNLAEQGLQSRGNHEEQYLQPLRERLETGRCPDDEASQLVDEHGIEALVHARTI